MTQAAAGFPRHPTRTRLIRQVHGAAAGIEKPLYRQLLTEATGKESCSAMSNVEMRKAIRHIEAARISGRLPLLPKRKKKQVADDTPMLTDEQVQAEAAQRIEYQRAQAERVDYF